MALALVASLLIACGGDSDAETSGTEIQGGDGSFTLELPEAWSVAEDEQAAAAIESIGGGADGPPSAGVSRQLEDGEVFLREGGSGDGQPASVTVLSNVLPEGFDFETAVETGVAVLLEQGVQVDGDPEPLTLDGDDAFEVRYAASPGGTDLQFALVQALHGGTVYSISLASSPEQFEEARSEYQQIIDSWRWR